MQRVDLDIVQEAMSLGPLFLAGMSRSEICGKLNKSDGWVQARQRVFELPHVLHPEIKDKVITTNNLKELHTKFLKEGASESFCADVRWIKERKAKGAKGVSLADRAEKEEAKTAAKVRTQSEITSMQGRIQSMFGNTGMDAKLLGWAAGHISGDALEEAIKFECDAFEGYNYAGDA